MNRFLTLLAAIFVLLIAFYLRTHRLNEYPPGISTDEAIDLIDAGQMLEHHEPQAIFYADDRAEALHRYIMAVLAIFTGQTIFAYRLTTVFIGVLAVAAAGGATQAFFRGYSRARILAIIGAMSVLAVNEGYVTLSRSLYRGSLTPLITLLFFWAVWHGLATRSRRWMIAAGVFLGLTLHTYTSALFMIFVLLGLVIHLMVFRFRQRDQWRRGLIGLLIAFHLIAAPTTYVLLTNPDRVLIRVQQVTEDNTPALERLSTYLDKTIDFFVNSGDPNPQYNTSRAPLLIPHTALIFLIGLLICILLIRRTQAAVLLMTLIVAPLPVLLSGEIPHGHRIVLAYAVIPPIYGVAFGQITAWIERWQWGKWITPIILIGMMIALPLEAARVGASYRHYFSDKETTWKIWGEELSNGAWFFLPQTIEASQYISQQHETVYLSAIDAVKPSLRAALLAQFPKVRSWGDLPRDENGMPLLQPGYLLAADDIQYTPTGRIAPDFRMMVMIPPNQGTIYLLPPLSDTAAAAVSQQAHNGQALMNDQGKPFAYRAEGIDHVLEFATIQPASGAIWNEQMQIVGYTIPDHLEAGIPQTYCLIWQRIGNISRHYHTQAQLWYNGIGVSGSDQLYLRWLYPTSLWRAGDQIPDCHPLTLPENAAPGIYRLAAGVYEERFPPLEAADPQRRALGTIAQIGWIKIPQAPITTTPQYPLDAYLITHNDQRITLLGYDLAGEIQPGAQLDLTLYWESSGRPDRSYTIFVHILDPSDQIVTQSDAEPWNGIYPTFIWDAGEVVQTTYQLMIPENAQVPLVVHVGMYTQGDFQRLAAVQRNDQQDFIILR